jgi:hypothetical protein
MAEDTARPETPLEMGGNDPEDMDAVADRLEVALERIARHLETTHLDTADLDTANLDTANLDTANLDTANLDTGRPAPPSAELVARLDGLIVRLRDVLGGPPSPSRD